MSAGSPPGTPMPNREPTQPAGGRPPVRLRVQVGTAIGRTYTMSGDTLRIGRSPDNDLVLDDVQVSRYHARLLRQDDVLIIEDAGSTNGTLVNGRRITQPHVLQPTETIAIGGTVFSVEGVAAPTTIGIAPVGKAHRREPAVLGRPPAALGPAGLDQPPLAPTGQRSRQTFWLFVGGVGGLIVLVVLMRAGAFLLSQSNLETPPSVPSVFIQSPVAGSQLAINQPVTVNAIASDSSGVARAELWVGGTLVDQQQSTNPRGQPSWSVSLRWTPSAAGSYTLEVRAYNDQGTASAPTTVMVVVAGDQAPGATPNPSSATASGTPAPAASPAAVTTVGDLNVREGPGQNYPSLTMLPVGSEVQITGKNPDGTWWQIAYPAGKDGHGWLYAPFTRPSNAEQVPVVETPPPPTPTATPSATPTETITPTPVPLPTHTPPVAAPPPASTPLGQGTPTVELSVSRSSIRLGECVTVRWHIENVTAAYLDGGEFKRLGVTGPLGSHDVCPSTTTLYTLRVDTAGGPIERAITVFVSLDQAPGQEQTITINGTGGSVREDGVLLPQAMAGDDDHDRALRAFMAFDVSGLAGARIVEARLELINSTQVGSPFTSLGGLYLEEVAWGPSLSATDYARPAMLSLRNLSSPAYLRVAMDVADSLAQYTAGGRDRFGLRLRFEKGSNGNRAEDYVSWAGARLTVRFAR